MKYQLTDTEIAQACADFLQKKLDSDLSEKRCRVNFESTGGIFSDPKLTATITVYDD
jgi:hypothetical protein